MEHSTSIVLWEIVAANLSMVAIGASTFNVSILVFLKLLRNTLLVVVMIVTIVNKVST